MTIYLLSEEHLGFPDPALADDDGLLAVGGDLSPPRLSLAYSLGIFPWYGPGSPILWWSPNPRMVLFPGELHLSASLRRSINAGKFRVTLDRAFDEVIEGCAAAERPDQDGTWLVPEMVRAYCRLHRKGLAHSAEAWTGGELAGGVYGVAVGGAFFAESMFYSVSDASKIAFVYLVSYLRSRGFSLIDCQQSTAHSARFGAREIPRQEFFLLLRRAVAPGERPEIWELPEGFRPLSG